jgi:F-type H+-transporting ATPase subunit b
MLETLGVKWPEFIASLINFSIVLFVLWRFAYKPIFEMLATRRQKIADSVANADKIKTELARTEADRQKTLADAGDQANKLIDDARQAAAQERAQMLAQLKREVGRLVVQTTATVTGKVLTNEDQQRLAQETEKQLAA